MNHEVARICTHGHALREDPEQKEVWVVGEGGWFLVRWLRKASQDSN